MRRTKIIATLGASPDDPGTLAKRFEEALKQAREEPISKPSRDFDLD